MKKLFNTPMLLLLVLVMIALSCSPERERARSIQKDVVYLARELGSRSTGSADNLERAAAYIRNRMGHDLISREQIYYINKKPYRNLVFEKVGEDPSLPVIIMGAHYDSVPFTPGADDNASGVSMLISVAHAFERHNNHTIRYVFFTLEEAPYSFSENMGSMRYARYLRDRHEKIKLMICLEMVGYYSDERIQEYPSEELKLHYPAEGNYAAVVGRPEHRRIVTNFYTDLKNTNRFPVAFIVAPPSMRGIGFSDHASFWEMGYPALMVTDTSFYRNKNYHKKTDLPETLDYLKMSLLAGSLAKVLEDLDRDLF
jgi:Zn-dependent M28 family amino/carboxypeptidase